MNGVPDVCGDSSSRSSAASKPRASCERKDADPPPEYSHDREMSRLDEINKCLEDMMENLIKTSIRCHTLEVDLTTQFSPYMMEAARNVGERCEKCTKKLEDLTGDSGGDSEHVKKTNYP